MCLPAGSRRKLYDALGLLALRSGPHRVIAVQGLAAQAVARPGVGGGLGAALAAVDLHRPDEDAVDAGAGHGEGDGFHRGRPF